MTLIAGKTNFSLLLRKEMTNKMKGLLNIGIKKNIFQINLSQVLRSLKKTLV
jgi:hypothetical protein